MPAQAGSLAAVMPVRIARLLAARGVRTPQEADLRLATLAAPQAMPGLQAAAVRLADAIEREERILVVGDFDADGATGTALAVRGLRLMGAREVQFAVPDRQRHGYGLSTGLVDELLVREPGVLLTVDQGTSSHSGVERARAAGIDVLVSDHHLPGPTLPAALAVVNPNLQPGHPQAALAGVGVVFHLLAALRAELGRRRGTAPALQLSALLDLVALGTVADLVPLDRDNRILVAEGLRRIRAGRACAGIAALIESAGRDPRRLVAGDLGFYLGPRLNAAGRLDDMSLGIRLLVCDDVDETRALAAQLSDLNHERRSLQADMEREAAAIVEQLLASRAGRLPPALVVSDPGWHPGVVGLVASRLAEKLHRPTIALAPVEPGGSDWRGSGRSIPGFHLRDALVEIDRRCPALLGRFGGHAMAAGLGIDASGLAELAVCFEAVAGELLGNDQLQRTVWTDGALAGQEFELALAQAIEAVGPWGQAFPEPLFDNEFEVLQRRVLKDKHLKLKLRAIEPGARPVDAIWFSAPAGFLASTPDRVRLLYRLAVERWQGVESVGLQVRHGFPM